ncbi:peroxiredoxin-like family protein [Rubellicoccus peritrichatus]|uniref:Peroxiredoxin-like family protein n=1 Tax=Rubellicoccus peritrichatus TaxID=3080537 RepID=A0AAQ3L9Q4_9BACT|nr:peroxiredoxin-like family protein [Puniceicoccus sp. CR14]WOO41691.1 peroxiredoxin-like family protein [Puniceicoccus sp. CR14]
MRLLAVNETLPEAAQALSLLNERNESVRFGSLLGGQPSVFVFLRHFGCIACSEHITAWKPRFAEFERLGICIALIGNGTVEHLKGFVDRYGLAEEPVQTLTDPTLELHRMLSLKHSIASTISPWSIKNALRAFGHGHWQKTVEGDPMQQGGLLIVDSEKRVQLIHREKAVGDFMDVSDVFDAAVKLITLDSEEVL